MQGRFRVISSSLREIPISQVQDGRARNSGGRLSSPGLENQVIRSSGRQVSSDVDSDSDSRGDSTATARGWTARHGEGRRQTLKDSEEIATRRRISEHGRLLNYGKTRKLDEAHQGVHKANTSQKRIAAPVAPSDKARGDQEYDNDSWTPVRIQMVRNVVAALELWEHLTAIIALTLIIIINELERMSADRRSSIPVFKRSVSSPTLETVTTVMSSGHRARCTRRPQTEETF
jgi:hypothetical protein